MILRKNIRQILAKHATALVIMAISKSFCVKSLGRSHKNLVSEVLTHSESMLQQKLNARKSLDPNIRILGTGPRSLLQMSQAYDRPGSLFRRAGVLTRERSEQVGAAGQYDLSLGAGGAPACGYHADLTIVRIAAFVLK